MIRHIKDCTQLNNGLQMPWLGFGVYKIKENRELVQSVNCALEIGYRSIDTAAAYGNESDLGEVIQACGIPREDIFLTTKVQNNDQREKRTLASFEESLERLKTDYVDLYLIHWPVSGCYIETWQVMEEIYQSGRAKAIGVSNFLIRHLEDLLDNCQVVPAVNQMEFHPYLVQQELLSFCKMHQIQMEAWSPLMQGHIVTEPVAQKLAEKYDKSPAQIVLRWDLQHEVVTIPKSVHPHRIAENADVFDFELSEEDMNALDALDHGKRFGPDPETFV